MFELDRLLDRRLVFVTGKGGIGKSLVTASLGQAAAARGKRVLIVESSHQDQLAPIFGSEPIGHRETGVGPNISAINLAASENFREYVTKHLGQAGLFEKVFSNKVVKSFINMIPGFAEVMLLGRLFYTSELAAEPRFDLIIFDGFASGHFLSLMTTPDAAIDSGLGGPLVTETTRVKNFLNDRKKVATLYVTVPEDLPVSECLDFCPRLMQKSPAGLYAIVVNRVWPAMAGNDSAAGRYLQSKLATQSRALATLKAGCAGHVSLRNVPLAFLPEMGAIAEPLSTDFGAEWWAAAGTEAAQ